MGFPSSSHALLVLILGSSAWAESDTCGDYKVIRGPRLDVFAKNNCDSSCPVAVFLPNDACYAICIAKTPGGCSEANKEFPLFNQTSSTCGKCSIANCRECVLGPSDSEICNACHHGFEMQTSENGTQTCELPFEETAATIVKYALRVLVLIFLLLGILFGGMRHFVGRQASKILEFAHLAEADNQYTDLREDESGEIALNLSALKYGLNMAYQSSISKAMSRRHVRRLNCGLEPKRPWYRKYLKEVTFDSRSPHGIGLTLFFNTQKFLILLTALVWVLNWGVDAFSDVDQVFDCLTLTKDNHLHCCGEGGLDIVQHAEDFAWGMIRFSISAWLASMALTLIFCYCQKYLVAHGEKSVSRGPLEQDYTLRLEGVPCDVTSERELHQQLEEKLDVRGKIYGVSIVYDIKGETIEEDLKKMVDNLVQFDCYQQSHQRTLQKLFTRHQSGVELGNVVEDDAHNFLKMLKGKGKWGQQAIKGSGIAYVTFKFKKDLRMVLSTTRGVPWELKDNPYHIIDVLPCSYTPREVLWNECVQSYKETFWNVIRSTIKMLIFFCLMVGFSYLFFQFIVWPYHKVGTNPAKTSKGFKYLGYIVSTFNSNIPGLVPGLALGIGFTRMGQVDNFIFVFTVSAVLLMNGLSILTYVDLSEFKLLLHDATAQELYSESTVITTMYDVMMPGLTMWGYVEAEVLLALYSTLMSVVFIAVIYVFGMFPVGCRKMLSSSMLGFQDVDKNGGRETEKAVGLQPYYISLEYSYMIWIPAIYWTSFFLYSQTSDDCCRGLVYFSLLYRLWQHINIHVFRETSLDSEDTFCTTMYFFGIVLQMFPACACWWAIRLNYVTIKVGIVLLVATPVLGFGAYTRVLIKMDFWHMHHTSVKGMPAEELRTMDMLDKGYEKCLDFRVFSWWNTNPVYVLKHRYCPNVPGFEVYGKDTKCWPEGSLDGLAEQGAEFRLTPDGHVFDDAHSKKKKKKATA